MVLKTINTDDPAWIRMNWKCSYIMQWPNICYVVHAILGTFDGPEVLAGNRGERPARVNPGDRPDQKEMMVLRGYSKVFRGKISIIFQTQTNDMIITIPKSLGLPFDYESLCQAVGPFVDSIELRMYATK